MEYVVTGKRNTKNKMAQGLFLLLYSECGVPGPATPRREEACLQAGYNVNKQFDSLDKNGNSNDFFYPLTAGGLRESPTPTVAAQRGIRISYSAGEMSYYIVFLSQ